MDHVKLNSRTYHRYNKSFLKVNKVKNCSGHWQNFRELFRELRFDSRPITQKEDNRTALELFTNKASQTC